MDFIRYKAVAPAKDKDGKLCYSEKTLGVQFTRGVAIFDDVTLQDANLGRSAAEIAQAMETDFGYTVTRMTADGKPLSAKKQEPVAKVEPVDGIDFELPEPTE
jgi:hypothetical protein